MKTLAIVCSGLVIVTLSACGGSGPVSEVDYSALDAVPKEAWEGLARKKIFFGHQSVGYNIVDGLKDIQAIKPYVRLNIQETRDPKAFEGGGIFAHGKLGKNRAVDTKCDGFNSALREGLGDKLDIAFFKLCYVDVMSGADAERLFKQYVTTIEEARQKYPNLVIVPVTVPLTAVPTGAKQRVKTLLGRGSSAFEDNRSREKLNRLLVERYGQTGQLFDLARLESTQPDGSTFTVQRDGVAVPAMVPSYTFDDGHLNESGRRRVAASLLLMLAKLSQGTR